MWRRSPRLPSPRARPMLPPILPQSLSKVVQVNGDACSMTIVLLAGASIESQEQTKSVTKQEEAPLRVALAGLVHGHASGFFDQFQRRSNLRIVGIAEANRQLGAQFQKQYGLEPGIVYSDLEKMLKATHPQAVLAYTNTYDHRRVVEICARYSVPVMME